MRLISLLLFVTIFSFNVFAATLTVTDSLELIGEESSSPKGSFSITAVDSVNNINIDYSALDLSDGDHNITLSFSPAFPITNLINQTYPIELTATIPNNMDLGIYGGVINITGTNTTGSLLSDKMSLRIIVKPEVCEDGVRGNVKITNIETPDNDDDFKPNDNLEMEVDVDNNDNDDLTIQLEALLYNMNRAKKITSNVSDKKEIEGDDKDTFDNFDLKIPTDSKYLKTEDDYMLFIKAYEYGDEDQHCDEKYVELNLELEEDDVVVETVTFSPQTASCGDTVTANINVRNIGSEDQDNVRVELKQDQLKINKLSDYFNIAEFDDKDDNYKTETFTFSIPTDADEKEYKFTSTVYFGTDSYTFDTLNPSSKLTVSGCGETITETTTGQSILSVSSPTSVAIGSTLSIPYVITNRGSTSQTYIAEFIPSGTWSTKQTQTVTVGAGQAEQFTITTITTPGTPEGRYSATLKLLSGSTLLDSKTISLELLNPNTITTRAIYRKTVLDDLRIGNLPTSFWIIGNIILAVIILILSYLLLRK